MLVAVRYCDYCLFGVVINLVVVLLGWLRLVTVACISVGWLVIGLSIGGCLVCFWFGGGFGGVLILLGVVFVCWFWFVGIVVVWLCGLL